MRGGVGILLAGALAGYGAGALAVDGDVERGQELAEPCAACHGADGVGVSPEWPSLAGQHADYTYKHLKLFAEGERWDPDGLMTAQAQGLSDQDMKDLAAYFESLEPPRGEADPEHVERGEQIYRAGIPDQGVPACIACHGPGGEGVKGARYPKVGGQHAVYLERSMHGFRDGERASDPNEMMRTIASRMSEEDIEAISSYIQGLTPRD